MVSGMMDVERELERWRPGLISLIRRANVPEQDIDDILQDVSIKFVQKYDSKISSPSTFLYRLVNQAVFCYRRRRMDEKSYASAKFKHVSLESALILGGNDRSIEFTGFFDDLEKRLKWETKTAQKIIWSVIRNGRSGPCLNARFQVSG